MLHIENAVLSGTLSWFLLQLGRLHRQWTKKIGLMLVNGFTAYISFFVWNVFFYNYSYTFIIHVK